MSRFDGPSTPVAIHESSETLLRPAAVAFDAGAIPLPD